MFMLGLVLFGSTVLLPQLMQTLLGYSAKDAGMAAERDPSDANQVIYSLGL